MQFSIGRSAIAAAAVLALLAGCSSSDDQPDTTVDSSPTTQTPTGEEAGAAGIVGDDLSEYVTVEGERLEAPEFTWLTDEAPEGLIVEVLVEGDGAVVPEGGYVQAHYEGRVWGSDAPFDSSYERGEGAAFPLDGVVAGWRDGIPGHTVGSRLLISIPSELGYPNGNPGAGIEVGDTIVFVVDVLDADAVPAADAVAENASVKLDDGASIAFTSQEGHPAEFELTDAASELSETAITTIGEGTGPSLEMGDWVAIAYTVRNVATGDYFSTWEIDEAETSGKAEVAILGQGSIMDLAVGQNLGSRVLIEVVGESDGPVIFVVDLLSTLLTD